MYLLFPQVKGRLCRSRALVSSPSWEPSREVKVVCHLPWNTTISVSLSCVVFFNSSGKLRTKRPIQVE